MRRQLAAVALLAILSNTVDASIVDSNDLSLPSYQSADGMNITTDTATGLDWLDIDTTFNISFNTMSGLLGVGELAAFRYASLAEVDVFFNNLGVPSALPLRTTTVDPRAEIFLSATGHTGRPGGGRAGRRAVGLTSEGTSTSLRTTAEISHSLGVTQSRTGVDRPGDAFSYLGSWIVRPSEPPGGVIPEPSSVIVWSLLGALGLAAPKWRRRFRCSKPATHNT